LPTNDQEACPAGFFILYSKGMFEVLSPLISESTSYVTPLITACAVLSFAWLAVCYKKLSGLRKEIDAAFEKIDVHIKERHHLAPALLDSAKQHTQGAKAATLLIENALRARHTMATAAERVRAFSNDPSSINSLVNADVAFNLALENVVALQHTQNSLGNDELFRTLVKKLNAIESNISFTHQLYNDVVNSYNSACATFPSVLLAGALGFRTAGTLAASQQRNASKAKLSQA
jgi:LemA protein